jgi:hypothetical protein
MNSIDLKISNQNHKNKNKLKIKQKMKENALEKKVKKQKEKTYLVFISEFRFIGRNLNSMQTLSHACLPLLYFLGQVIHFWMEE